MKPAVPVAPAPPALFPRHIAIAVLLAVACTFAGNHIAARVAFDHGTGLLLAVLLRAGATLLLLGGLVWWQRETLRLPPGTAGWQLLLGLLIAVQSLCLYSAVARIPVALALLISNTFPILLALITWALGGRPPSRRTSAIMATTLAGLVLVLDVPSHLSGAGGDDPHWWAGVAFAMAAATVFAFGLWITDHQLKALRGPVRSFMTMAIVVGSIGLAGAAGLVPGGMSWPQGTPGWVGLACLMLLYGVSFSVLFVTLPRLNMAENAPVMNMEPLASLLLGWWLLGQALAPIQLLGGAVVLLGIVWLAKAR